MSNQRFITRFEDVHSRQRPVAGVRGDYSGNIGSHNIAGSGNFTASGRTTNYGHITNHGITTNNYFTDTNSGSSGAEILRTLYTSRYQSHLARVREPAAGTCTWVTKHPRYKEWLRRKTTALLWLSADPGCGKSVIAAFLVNHLKLHGDAIVCYFFFKDDNEEQRSPTFALCAILHQLFAQRNSLCKYAKKAFKAQGKRLTEEMDTLWDILVKAVAEGGCGKVICVVDALDECDEGALAQFTHRITSLPRSKTPNIQLKFFVTGRPYHRIERQLGPRTKTIRLRGEDEVRAMTADVTRVINEGIHDLESIWRRPGRFGYLRKILVSSAGGTFLWVSLMLEILNASVDDSRETFTTLVSTAPRDLPLLYTSILNKSPDPKRARRILHIVVAAARPLTLCEMNVAFRIRRGHTTMRDIGDLSPRSGRTVKNLCGLFVRIIDSKVYLVHQTAREFLIQGNSAGRGEWQHTLRSMDSNFILADICISYLSLQDFGSRPLSMDSPNTHKRAREEGVRNFFQHYAFLEYAASHWASHFRDSQNRQMELFRFTRVICQRGSGRFLTWLKVYWENNGQYCPFPNDFTHLMIAAWLGQQRVIKRLLKEGGDINARSVEYGTALNIAALRRHRDIAKTLVEGGVNAYIGGREYNILLTWKSELVVSEQYRPRMWSETPLTTDGVGDEADGK
uniref:NACHT-ANK domain protein transcript variant 4 n=1 Tax=Tuber melanosporum TaxID=39416 RepID=H6VQS2_TUBME|nr:NACHT-ANK domain protein transcript variant 4 [Tuber melanosporum]